MPVLHHTLSKIFPIFFFKTIPSCPRLCKNLASIFFRRSFQVLEGGSEVSLELSLLEAEKAQLPQALFIGALWSSLWLSLGTTPFIPHAGGPRPGHITEDEIRRAEQMGQSPPSPCRSTLHLCWPSRLQEHTASSCPAFLQNPQVLPHRVALNKFFSQSIVTSGIALTLAAKETRDKSLTSRRVTLTQVSQFLVRLENKMRHSAVTYDKGVKERSSSHYWYPHQSSVNILLQGRKRTESSAEENKKNILQKSNANRGQLIIFEDSLFHCIFRWKGKR